MVQTRDQKFANAAIEQIKAVEADQKDYRTTALSFPVLLLQSGLAQAIGFLTAKKKTVYLGDLEAVLQKAGVLPAGNDVLQQRAVSCSLAEYQRLTRETLAAAGWLKRFVQAEFKD